MALLDAFYPGPEPAVPCPCCFPVPCPPADFKLSGSVAISRVDTETNCHYEGDVDSGFIACQYVVTNDTEISGSLVFTGGSGVISTGTAASSCASTCPDSYCVPTSGTVPYGDYPVSVGINVTPDEPCLYTLNVSSEFISETVSGLTLAELLGSHTFTDGSSSSSEGPCTLDEDIGGSSSDYSASITIEVALP